MDGVVIDKIILTAMQLRWILVCKEIKLFFKFNIKRRPWRLFYKLVLHDSDYFELISSPKSRRNSLIKFNMLTRISSFI